MDGERVCSWTVVGDGKVLINQVGGDVAEQFPTLLGSVVNDLLARAGNWHGVLETFSDGTQSLTIKSVR